MYIYNDKLMLKCETWLQESTMEKKEWKPTTGGISKVRQSKQSPSENTICV